MLFLHAAITLCLPSQISALGLNFSWGLGTAGDIARKVIEKVVIAVHVQDVLCGPGDFRRARPWTREGADYLQHRPTCNH